MSLVNSPPALSSIERAARYGGAIGNGGGEMRHVLRTFVLALALAVGLGVAHSAKATFPGTNGKIAFADGGNIWTMNPDGTNKVQLTTGGNANEPRWRPDGRKIAYIRSPTFSDLGTILDAGGIEVVNADGTGVPQRILDDPDIGFGLTWSPDCTRLAYGHFDDVSDPTEHIWALNVASGATTQLTTGATLDRSPDFSPDGTKIAFTSTRQTGADAIGSTNHVLFAMKADGTGVTRLTTLPDPTGAMHERNPSWKPDGSSIVLRSDNDFGENGETDTIYVVSADGSTRTLLETSDGPLVGANPVWSPDGTKVVLMKRIDRATSSLAVYDVATQALNDVSATGREPDWVASNGSCSGSTDTVPPTLTVPQGVDTDATGPGGAVVSFTATATDNADQSPSVMCAPASNTLFPVGDTTVSCTAKDNSGNTTVRTFTVHVRGPIEQLTLLSAKILVDPGIAPRLRPALAAQVQAVVTALMRGVVPARVTCLGLTAGIVEVRVLPLNLITAASRSSITADLTRIRAAVGC
jgi:Tol biopolymer transport system component